MHHHLSASLLAVAFSLAVHASADTAQQRLELNCEAWINLGSSQATEVLSQDLATWLIQRDSSCKGIESWVFENEQATKDACTLRDIDPTDAYALINIDC